MSFLALLYFSTCLINFKFYFHKKFTEKSDVCVHNIFMNCIRAYDYNILTKNHQILKIIRYLLILPLLKFAIRNFRLCTYI